MTGESEKESIQVEQTRNTPLIHRNLRLKVDDPVGCLLALACVLVIVLLQSCSSSLVSIGNAGAGALGATTYPSEDGAILGAEAAYAGLEAELQTYLDTYESTHDYDEYHFDLDEIEHDPYVLISQMCIRDSPPASGGHGL